MSLSSNAGNSTVKLAALLFACAFSWNSAIAQIPQPPAAAASSEKSLPTAYDVVSVKPHKGDDGSWWRTTSGAFSAEVPVRSLIMSAYNLIMLDQVSGLPDWAERDSFDVEGKLDSDTAEAFARLSRSDQSRQRQLMMQALLADRFKLRIRRETRELAVYNLVIAKGGIKMKEAPPTERSSYSMGLGRINGDAMQIDNLAFSLSNPVGRLIIDKTGLTGKYQVSLNWAWNDEPGSGDTGPSIFTALQEQLGLKLEPAKAPIDVVVIDHIERPSEN